MEIQSIIVDNFLENPDKVREHALLSEFEETSKNFPGARSGKTDEDYSNHVKEKIENIMKCKISEWHETTNPFTGQTEDNSTTCFQICLEDAKTWIHNDPSRWTAILYLTPNAPIEAGTCICRHKPTGTYIHFKESKAFSENPEDWEVIAFFGNIYNRLVIFNGHSYHRSHRPGFGNDKYNGRLTQTFFFNLEEGKE